MHRITEYRYKFEYNIIPFPYTSNPDYKPEYDLKNNPLVAHELIQIATTIFGVRPRLVEYRGFAYESPYSNLVLKLRHGNVEVYMVTLPGFGFSGLVEVEILRSHFGEAFRKDVFAGLKKLATKVWPHPMPRRKREPLRKPNHRQIRVPKADLAY